MNASFLLLSSAWMASADPAPPAAPPAPAPIVVSGSGCTNCGSSGYAGATFASASFGASACGDACGSARLSLLERLRAKFARPAGGCGVAAPAVCSSTPACAAPTCGGTLLRSAFPATTYSAPAPACDTGCGPVLHSAFAPAPSCGDPCGSSSTRVGLFARLRARLCGSRSVAAPVVVSASPCGGCGSSVAAPAPVSSVPAPMPVPTPVVPPKDMPKPTDTPKDKTKTSADPAPVVPLTPSELPRIPTLNGNG